MVSAVLMVPFPHSHMLVVASAKQDVVSNRPYYSGLIHSLTNPISPPNLPFGFEITRLNACSTFLTNNKVLIASGTALTDITRA